MPLQDIKRLIAPRSIALIGAAAWTDAVAAGNQAIGYRGAIWRVHPTRASTPTTRYFRSISELPEAPDAAFVAVPSEEAPLIAGALAAADAGGYVCFTAGFSETGTLSGDRLTRELLAQSRALPFLGPNCYGFVNFFDRAAMLPDQVVGDTVKRGVAVICQSGTIALTLMFNARSLPIGYLITVGNQTRLAVEDLIVMLCEDPRVSAFGLYLEGVKDAARFADAVEHARAAGKPIAVIKSGRTAAAARTALSHTGALAGADSVFDAFCRQTGLARCDTLGTLCETLKVFHVGGVLAGRKVLIMGASGGDMAMTADLARTFDLDFATLPSDSAAGLRTLLSNRVTIANPLDIHTYLWFDPPALKRVFAQALHAGYAAVGFMLDCPPVDQADTASFDVVIEAFIEAAQTARTRAVLIASLPETMGVRIRKRCIAGGVVPMQGQREALEALALTAAVGAAWSGNNRVRLRIPQRPARNGDAVPVTLSEVEGKAELARFDVPIPRGKVVPAALAAEAAIAIGFPVVLKAVGAHLEHKTDLGAVVLNVRNSVAAAVAAERLGMLSDLVLVEEMTIDGVAEVIVGVIADPHFGQVLVLGAGGILAELLSDTVTLLPPWTRESIHGALRSLTLYRVLSGYRSKPAGDVDALVATVMNIARYAESQLTDLVEIDVNPVIVRPRGQGAVVVDTLIRLTKPQL